MRTHISQRGYTMVELVVYLAIFVTISVIIVHSLVSVMRTYATASAYRKLQTNGNLIMERIVREARDANSITLADSTFDVHPGELSIETTDDGGMNHSINFSVSNGIVQVVDNGTTGNLSSSEVSASSLVFRRITSDVADGVKVELTLTTNSGHIVSAPFYATVMLRGNN